MKRAIALGLLTVLLVMGIGSVSVSQDELSPDRFATFADWCHHRDSLTPEAQHTVETLLEEAGTQECNQAEDRLTHLIELDLDFKQIVDVAPLATLTNLVWLYLSDNPLENRTCPVQPEAICQF